MGLSNIVPTAYMKGYDDGADEKPCNPSSVRPSEEVDYMIGFDLAEEERRKLKDDNSSNT